MTIMGIPKGNNPVATLIAEKVTALLNAELATVMSNSYRRGMVDQFYQPLSEESVVRIRKSLEAEGVTDPSWPPLDATPEKTGPTPPAINNARNADTKSDYAHTSTPPALEDCRNEVDIFYDQHLVQYTGGLSYRSQEAVKSALKMYAQQNTITPPAASDLRELEDELCRDAAELPDRTSPDDYPDMLLLTPEELIGFLRVYGAAVRAEAESVPTWDDERTKLIEALQEYGDHAGWCLDRHGDLKATDECQCGWNGVRADWLVTHRPGAGK